MRIVFAGTPEFAVIALDAICAAGHQVVAVLTQPDRPAGRGMRMLPGAVKQRALAMGIQVLQPVTLKDTTIQQQIGSWFVENRAEVMVVAAYGLLLPPAVLALPRLGCLNIHASILPRWRGAAPIERALNAGDADTGICIMQMDAGLDSGPVLLSRRLAIDARDSAGSLRARLAEVGAAAIVEVLAMLERGVNPVATPQPAIGATYAPKIGKAEASLDFNLSALELDRRIRAFDPTPGTVALLDKLTIKFWRAHAGPRAATAQAPGTVLAVASNGVSLACGADGRDTLVVEELQKPGGKRLAAAQFLTGFPLAVGERFATPV